MHQVKTRHSQVKSAWSFLCQYQYFFVYCSFFEGGWL